MPTPKQPLVPPAAPSTPAAPAARHRVAAEDGAAGTRLDRFLADTLPALSRSRIRVLIEQGAVLHAAGGETGRTITEPAKRVKPGEVFEVRVPAATDPVPQAQDIALDIRYEDDAVVVLNKPAGLVVHPAPGNPDRTLVNALIAHCGASLSGIGGVRRPGIVHRLDKDTSGLMVAAKTDAAHAGLAAQFERHEIARAYRAVVWGEMRPPRGEIAGNIGRSRGNRKKMAVVPAGGKPALTRYCSLKCLAGGAASLAECRLATGRTHQIRVHMAHIGHAVVGDPLYGRARGRLRGVADEIARTALGSFPRQALHAGLLGFRHPLTAEHMEFVSDLPPDMVQLVGCLDRF